MTAEVSDPECDLLRIEWYSENQLVSSSIIEPNIACDYPTVELDQSYTTYDSPGDYDYTLVVTDIFDCPENQWDDTPLCTQPITVDKSYEITVHDYINSDPIAYIKVSENELGDIPIDQNGFDYELTIPHDGNLNSSSINLELDGLDSEDPEGCDLLYEWTDIDDNLLSTDSIYEIQLSEGVYNFNLQVTDPDGSLNEKQISVIVNAEENNAPIANAGNDAEYEIAHDCAFGYPDTTIVLDGRDSQDLDLHYFTGQQDPITYQWLLDGEEVSTDSEYEFSTNIPGEYCYTLIVTDSYGLSSQIDDVCHTVTLEPNQKPVAMVEGRVNDSGNVPVETELVPDGIEFELTIPHDADISTNSVEVELDGGDSYDPEDCDITFEWRDSNGDVIGSDQTITFNLEEGQYDYYLTVVDSDGLKSNTKEILVIVNAEENNAPIANAGNDAEYEIAHDCAFGYPDTTIVLDGRDSQDLDLHYFTGQQDPITYQWLLDGEEVSTDSEYEFSTNIPGEYCYTLIVTDSYGLSSQIDDVCHTITLQPNQKPVAMVEGKVNDSGNVPVETELVPDGIEFELTIPHDADISTNSVEVELDGGDSYDPEDCDITFEWRDSNGDVISSDQTITFNLEEGQYDYYLTVSRFGWFKINTLKKF